MRRERWLRGKRRWQVPKSPHLARTPLQTRHLLKNKSLHLTKTPQARNVQAKTHCPAQTWLPANKMLQPLIQEQIRTLHPARTPHPTRTLHPARTLLHPARTPHLVRKHLKPQTTPLARTFLQILNLLLEKTFQTSWMLQPQILHPARSCLPVGTPCQQRPRRPQVPWTHQPPRGSLPEPASPVL